MKTRSNRPVGFTLIELLVTIAILAIIASLAAPEVGVFVSRSAMRGISADFTLGMQRARSEAINRNQCVVMCMSSDGTSCADTGTNWGVGWIVFPSLGCSDTQPVAASDIILVRQAVGTRYALNSVDSSAIRSLMFSARGNISSKFGKFNLRDTSVSSSDSINRSFCLDKAGRVRTIAYGGSCS